MNGTQHSRDMRAACRGFYYFAEWLHYLMTHALPNMEKSK